MEEIYSGAYLTIVAATTLGLYSTSRGQKRPEKFRISRGRFWDESCYTELMETKWAKRGWTFQEHILSKRAVIFVNGDMFWDCQRSVWDQDELLPGNDLDKHGPASSLHHEIARRLSIISWPYFATYIEMVCLYNGRDLTYPEYALPAISGVWKLFKSSFPTGFVSG